MSTRSRRAAAALASGLGALLAGAAHAQVCERLGAERIACRFANPTRETMAITATARLRHVQGAVNGAVAMALDGRGCDVAPARWQLGTGEARARCLQTGGPLHHEVEARVYGVEGARLIGFDLSVQPAAGGLERLPRDADRLAPARRVRHGLGRLWPF